MTEYTSILVSKPAEHVALITLNRPNAANAFNTKMAEEFTAALYALSPSRDDEQSEDYSSEIRELRDIRCIVLTGAGNRAFSAGADLKERDGMSDAAWHAQHVIFERMFLALMECPLPVIAAVNGAAFGGGCEIVLACDFIYAAKNARFALPETSLGIMPGGGATQNLPHAVGLPRAKEIILAASAFSAEEAAAWGMVNHLSDPTSLMQDALAIAAKIARKGPLAVRQAKKAMNAAVATDRRAAYDVELEAYNQLIPTEDRREGVRAFNEKRPPVFKGK
jgi:enoyl-CoA hydratase